MRQRIQTNRRIRCGLQQQLKRWTINYWIRFQTCKNSAEISWQVRKHQIVALSSREEEYQLLAATVQEVNYLRSLLEGRITHRTNLLQVAKIAIVLSKWRQNQYSIKDRKTTIQGIILSVTKLKIKRFNSSIRKQTQCERRF